MNKGEARAASLASRARRSPAELTQAGIALAGHPWATWSAGGYATCYASMDGEPPTDVLIASLTPAGIKVALPIMRKGRALAWGWHNDELVRNSYGVLEPEADTFIHISEASLLIIPALRAGRDGTRLGRGAGYYDRALAQIPSHSAGGPLRAVVVFDDEVDDSVPHEPHDQRVDVVCTPTYIFHVD